MNCRICGKQLMWQAEINSAGEDVGFKVRYCTMEGDFECRTIAGVPAEHLTTAPETVKSLTAFLKWLDQQVQEEAYDREVTQSDANPVT